MRIPVTMYSLASGDRNIQERFRDSPRMINRLIVQNFGRKPFVQKIGWNAKYKPILNTTSIGGQHFGSILKSIKSYLASLEV